MTPFLWIFNKPILSLLESIVSKEAMQVAYFHLFFNCTTALITTPLIEYLVKIACFIVKDKKEELLIEGINDVEKLEINPRESTNTNNEDGNCLNEKEENKEEKYKPPEIINVENKDNNNDNDNDNDNEEKDKKEDINEKEEKNEKNKENKEEEKKEN